MLEVINLSVSFASSAGCVEVLNKINLIIPSGEICTLTGPSGAGKTTLLRSIAGLTTPADGIIRICNRTVYSRRDNVFISPNLRTIGMVPQSYALWPHLTVYENVAFPLRVGPKKGNLSARQIKDKVLTILSLVRMTGLEKRLPSTLSGGQQQRVALARALIAEPELLLLDEPLSNLDQVLRQQMREELQQLQQKIGLTMLYVTHDQTEARCLSQYVISLDSGTLTH